MKLFLLSVIIGIFLGVYQVPDTLVKSLRLSVSPLPPPDNETKANSFINPSAKIDENGSLNLCHNLRKDLKTVWSPDPKDYVFTTVLMDTCNWKFVSDHKNATILWTTGHSDMPSSVKKSIRYGKGQIWSQLEDSWLMADKARLHTLLKNVGRLDYQPETFYLDDLKECLNFFQYADRSPETIWVTKEPSSSQGDGIVINPDINALKSQWLVDPNVTSDKFQCKKVSNSGRIIVQKYVMNPLLLEGKKMEIRTYWAIVSVDPLIVIYRDGTVRLTTTDYVSGNWDNPLIHITNTKQQKKADPNYEKTVTQRKWTVNQLAKYLKDNNKISEDPDVWLNHLREMLIERIAVTVLAAHPQLKALKTQNGWDGRFELLGMDVILDDKLNVWLTEIQDGPSLSLDPGIKSLVIPELIRELVDVVMEVDTTFRSGRKLNYPLRSLGEWHQVDVRKYTHLINQSL